LKKIILVAGARPNFMKIAPLYHAFQKYAKSYEVNIVHTGQHYDKKMSDVFFNQLQMPKPHSYFGVGSGSHAQQTSNIMIKFEAYCLKQKPDLVIVVGDVNSTLACAVVAKKLHIQLAHVEAGLRSFDRRMPEEINRMVTDSISDYHFITEKSGMNNLLKEGHSKKLIYFVGNVMIDTLKLSLKKLDLLNLPKPQKKYGLITLHRPSNVDTKNNLSNIIKILKTISHKIPLIFPLHPRTKIKIKQFGFTQYFNFSKNLLNPRGITLVPPLGYLEFLNLMKHSAFCLTDSGGIQEETTVLKIPCLTMRDSTERPITCELGSNIMVGNDFKLIVTNINKLLTGKKTHSKIPPLWDGNAAKRIVIEIKKHKL